VCSRAVLETAAKRQKQSTEVEERTTRRRFVSQMCEKPTDRRGANSLNPCGHGRHVAPQAIRSSRGTIFTALSLSSGFTAENEVAARVGELYVNNVGVCGRLTLKAKSQKGYGYLSFCRKNV
jgi:hypothetical protein